MHKPWRPSLGAVAGPGHTAFRVWAPERATVTLVLDRAVPAGDRFDLPAAGDGYFGGVVEGVTAGDRYHYLLDGHGPFPDPVSRYQPEGVHGPSEVVDPAGFAWTDGAWRGVAPTDLVIYELHVGTFSPAGTFRGVIDRLPYLRDLGVSAIELMPVADFPGSRNWGYDGAALFAPARCYGIPDDLRALVNAAHHHGLAVLLDVVYNHVGPDGAYLFAFSPWYYTDARPSPWGKSVNLDGPHAGQVRAFLLENALHWVHEYRFDGLRLDATHAMHDDPGRPFLAELAEAVHLSVSDRRVSVVAEDHRNLASMVMPAATGGLGLDAVWADDLHHQVRRFLAGDSDGYYVDYSGTAADIAATIERGWFFTGQHSAYLDEPRGTDPRDVPHYRFVVCLQNHDQVGNRALGDRLHREIALPAFRAATVLLLTLPSTPLLFMGEEWAASTPFLYFTDHNPELGRLVTEGRRQEFARFAAFTDPEARARIPDPQAPETFAASRLRWSERQAPPHLGMLRLHQDLLGLRRSEAALGGAAAAPLQVRPVGTESLVMLRSSAGGDALVVVRLRGAGVVDVPGLPPPTGGAAERWRVRLTTESPRYADDEVALLVEAAGPAPRVSFNRPGAAVLTRARVSAAPAATR